MRYSVNKTLIGVVCAAGIAAGVGPVVAQTATEVPTDAIYSGIQSTGYTSRIQYEATLLYDYWRRDHEGDWYLIEEGIFNTQAQAEFYIELLAYMEIAYTLECSCSDTVFRDDYNVASDEELLMSSLELVGYNPRHITAAEMDTLDSFYTEGALEIFSGSKYLGGANSIFSDTRLSELIRGRIAEAMGSYDYNNPTSLCAFGLANYDALNRAGWYINVRQEFMLD